MASPSRPAAAAQAWHRYRGLRLLALPRCRMRCSIPLMPGITHGGWFTHWFHRFRVFVCSWVCGPIGRSKVLHVFLKVMCCLLLLWRAPVAPHDDLNICQLSLELGVCLKIGLSVLVPKSLILGVPKLESLFWGVVSLTFWNTTCSAGCTIVRSLT